MTKADIINEISEKTGIDKPMVHSTVDAFMKVVRAGLVNGEDVFLRGFGTFLLQRRAEKPAFDMHNKKKVIIPEHSVVKFKPVKSFSQRVKGSSKVESKLKDKE